MDGPPLAACVEFHRMNQGELAVCTGTLSPDEKLALLLDSYLHVPILEAEKSALDRQLEVERTANREMRHLAYEREFYESPWFWVGFVSVAFVGGWALGQQ